MKNRFIISEQEKSRILNMHKMSTIKNYLTEQKNDYDAIVGKTAYFTVKGIESIKDLKTKDAWYSNFNQLEQPLTDNDQQRIKYLSEKDEYGKIKSVELLYTGIKAIKITITSDMDLPLSIESEKEITLTYECNSGIFTATHEFAFLPADSKSWFLDKIMHINYTNEKLSAYLDSIMPCSKDAFDFSMTDEEMPNDFA